LPLTNTVKELEENLDFGIQKLIKSEPGLIPVNNDNEKHLDDVDGDADNFCDEVWARCNNETKRNESVLSQELEKQRKESRFNLCLDG
jgi:hypothetical protein